jgi:hypothetical protein
MLQLPNSMWSNIKEASDDLVSLYSLFVKFLGLSWNKRKVETTEDLSHYHRRHFQHRQLPVRHSPNPTPPSVSMFSLPHVRTRRSSTPTPSWQSLSSASELQQETQVNSASASLEPPHASRGILPATISRKIKKKKYSVFQALHLTLSMGELRVDLIDLFTTVCITPPSPTRLISLDH